MSKTKQTDRVVKGVEKRLGAMVESLETEMARLQNLDYEETYSTVGKLRRLMLLVAEAQHNASGI